MNTNCLPHDVYHSGAGKPDHIADTKEGSQEIIDNRLNRVFMVKNLKEVLFSWDLCYHVIASPVSHFVWVGDREHPEEKLVSFPPLLALLDSGWVKTITQRYGCWLLSLCGAYWRVHAPA
jgi:hypothetical protein